MKGAFIVIAIEWALRNATDDSRSSRVAVWCKVSKYTQIKELICS